MNAYDFVLVGGGLSGLSLAYQLVHSPLQDRSILIVDKDVKVRDERTWGFWTPGPTLFDEIVHRSWRRLQITSADRSQIIDLGRYRYQVIRGSDFYRFVREQLSARGNIDFAQGVVREVQDGPEAARVMVNGQAVAGRWVFDSRSRFSDIRFHGDRYHHLKLNFWGWEIETSAPAFDPDVATFLDFRTPQRGATRFFYVLPFSARRALVEYTLFSAEPLKRAEYEQALTEYVENVLGVSSYRLLRQERGCIPITDQPFPRQLGRRVMSIGAKGGRVKPTTGYAFARIQQDSAAILRSLLQNGHPFDVPADSWRYRLYDSILLEVMSRRSEQIQTIFAAMFQHNSAERIFRFLDQVGSLGENLKLIATLPPWVFLEALLQAKVRRALAELLTGPPRRLGRRRTAG